MTYKQLRKFYGELMHDKVQSFEDGIIALYRYSGSIRLTARVVGLGTGYVRVTLQERGVL